MAKRPLRLRIDDNADSVLTPSGDVWGRCVRIGTRDLILGPRPRVASGSNGLGDGTPNPMGRVATWA